MPSITVKNIPDQAYEILKKVATINHRSINSEIICLIEKATISKPFISEHYLAKAKNCRKKTEKYFFNSGDLQRAKEEGRS